MTRKGIDKAYGVAHLQQQLNLSLSQLLFVGDRLDEGGNDYPVKALGVECVPVASWLDTAAFIEHLLVRLADR